MSTPKTTKGSVQTAPADGSSDHQRDIPAKSGYLTALQSRRLKQCQTHYPSREKLFNRIYARQASPREAIKGFCLECNGWDETAILDCSSTACPIFAHRPFVKTVTKSVNS